MAHPPRSSRATLLCPPSLPAALVCRRAGSLLRRLGQLTRKALNMDSALAISSVDRVEA